MSCYICKAHSIHIIYNCVYSFKYISGLQDITNRYSNGGFDHESKYYSWSLVKYVSKSLGVHHSLVVRCTIFLYMYSQYYGDA
jgi:hypothetical protein